MNRAAYVGVVVFSMLRWLFDDVCVCVCVLLDR